jgi:hypothetical protein
VQHLLHIIIWPHHFNIVDETMYESMCDATVVRLATRRLRAHGYCVLHAQEAPTGAFVLGRRVARGNVTMQTSQNRQWCIRIFKKTDGCDASMVLLKLKRVVCARTLH